MVFIILDSASCPGSPGAALHLFSVFVLLSMKGTEKPGMPQNGTFLHMYEATTTY